MGLPVMARGAEAGPTTTPSRPSVLPLFGFPFHLKLGKALAVPCHFWPYICYACGMTPVSLGEVKNHLSEYVASVTRTHERVMITRHGQPTAVLISADDLAAIEETLDILRTPGALEAIQEGTAAAAAGDFADNDELKARYGIT